MLFGQGVKTVTHTVELPNFVEDRIRMHWDTRLPDSLTARAADSRKFVGDDELGTRHSGRRS
jgi:hypothetical protein